MLTIKQLNPKIAGIRKSTKAMRASIQEVLIHAAANAFQSGDVTAFTKLFDATRGADQKAIAKWAQTYGFAILKADGVFNVNKSMRKTADFADGDAVLAYLETQPTWYDMAASAKAIAKELDAVARIKSLTTQISKDSTVVKHVDFAAYRTAMADLDAAIKAAS